MRLALEVPIPQLLAEYRANCEQLRRLVARIDLDNASRGTLSWREEPVGVYARTGDAGCDAVRLGVDRSVGDGLGDLFGDGRCDAFGGAVSIPK